MFEDAELRPAQMVNQILTYILMVTHDDFHGFSTKICLPEKLPSSLFVLAPSFMRICLTH